MLREYEITVITKPNLSESETIDLLTRYENCLKIDGGEILKKDVWGQKKLAFPIKKEYRGFYTLYDVVTLPKNVTEMCRLMRIDDNVLRYLSVKISDEVDVEKRKVELAKAETVVDAAEESEDEEEEDSDVEE